MSNYKRLSAQWERRVKRLEDTLKADGKELPVRSVSGEIIPAATLQSLVSII